MTARGVGLRSLSAQIDTASATGRLVLRVFGALAEFERGLNHERTMAGLAAARARGRVGGRPPALTGRSSAGPRARPGRRRYADRRNRRHIAGRTIDRVQRGTG